VERGEEVHPGEASSVTLLGRQDIGNKMVPVEEPLLAKNCHDGRVRGPIILSLERFWDRVTRDRRGRGTRLHPLGQGSSRREGHQLRRVRALGRSLRGYGGKKARSDGATHFQHHYVLSVLNLAAKIVASLCCCDC
jgi:hypothetical protein